MNGIDVGDFRGADDAVDAQVAFAAGSFADANGFVRKLHVHGIGVHLGIDGDGADVQLLAGTNDANGDFAAVRNQNFLKHVANLFRSARQRRWSVVSGSPAKIKLVES